MLSNFTDEEIPMKVPVNDGWSTLTWIPSSLRLRSPPDLLPKSPAVNLISCDWLHVKQRGQVDAEIFSIVTTPLLFLFPLSGGTNERSAINTSVFC